MNTYIPGTLSLSLVLEWSGAVFGLSGSYLLAFHNHFSRYGWVAFFFANLAMALFAFMENHNGLLIQQVGFIGSSLLGLKRAGLLDVSFQKIKSKVNKATGNSDTISRRVY